MRKLPIVIVLAVSLAIGLSCAGTASPAPEKPGAPTPTIAPVKPVIFKYADLTPASTQRGQAIAATFAEIERLTQGRVKHECYWSESLAKGADILDAVHAGVADVGHCSSPAYHPGEYRLWQFTDLLFVSGDDQRAVAKALNEMHDTMPELKADMDKPGIHFLTFVGFTAANFISKVPLVDVRDFKGLRVRSFGAGAKWLNSIGAVPITLTAGEIPEAMSRGLLDAVQLYTYHYVTYKLYETCKFLTINGISHPVGDYKVNQDSWNKLSPADQKVYEDTMRSYYVDAYASYMERDALGFLKTFADAGVKVIELTPEQMAKWKESAAFIPDTFYADMDKLGVDGRKIVAEYQRLYKKYEAKK